MIRHIASIALSILIATPAFAAEQDLDIPNTSFVGATAFTRQAVGAPTRTGYLFFYKSELGESLRLRPVAQEELDEMRRVCEFMVQSAGTTDVKVDDYFLEFGAGEGDAQTIPQDKRFVFVFTRERGCAADPTPATLN